MLAYSEMKKGNGKTGRIILVSLLLIIGIFIFIFLANTPGQHFRDNATKQGSGQLDGNSRSGQIKDYRYIQKNSSDMGIGSLILVNKNFRYQFSGESANIAVFDNKNRSYKVSDKNITMQKDAILHFNQMMLDFEKAEKINDIIILSGFRTKDKQKEILEEKTRELGKEEAAKRVAQPGYSEHHTGYAMDIGILTDAGQTRNYTGSGAYGWINENCGDYGFILRYEEAKSKITGIIDEPWHYRYVGVPHANIIRENKFCLEEYLNYLKKFDFNSKHLEYTDRDNREYEIYYLPASDDQITGIPVPRSNKYSISGNNMDGFIVTIEK